MIEAQDANPTPARGGFLAQLEQNVLPSLGLPIGTKADWSVGSFNWANILAIIEQLMALLAPFLGGL